MKNPAPKILKFKKKIKLKLKGRFPGQDPAAELENNVRKTRKVLGKTSCAPAPTLLPPSYRAPRGGLGSVRGVLGKSGWGEAKAGYFFLGEPQTPKERRAKESGPDRSECK